MSNEMNLPWVSRIMDDELRKAAQVALAAMEKEWGTKLSKGNAYSFMKAARALRAALSNNANAAPSSDAEYIKLGKAMYEMTTTVHLPNVPFAEQCDLIPHVWKHFMDEANAAPDVSTSKTILVGRYIRENGLDSQCFTYPDDLPDGQYEMYLHLDEPVRETAIQTAMDDKRDAERWRFVTQHMCPIEVDYLVCFDAEDWAGRVDAAMQQEQKT